MTRLPQPGADKNTWGDILNGYLGVAHNADGSLKTSVITSVITNDVVKGAGAVTTINGVAPTNGNVTVDVDNASILSGVAVSGAPATGQVLQATGTNAATWATVTSSGTVSDATTGAKGLVQLAGNLAGTASAPTVTGVRGVTVSATAPTTNQVLAATGANGAAWSTLAPASIGALSASNNLSELTSSAATVRANIGLNTAGGDLSGTYPSPTVAKVNGVTVSGTPANGQVLQATSTTAATWATVTSSGTVSDATTGAKGIVQLAGDLAGTASAPTVPGLADKQATLVSGTNIKTINGTSLLGSGNITVSGGSGSGFTATAINANTTIANMTFALVTASSASVTITLPPATNGAFVRVKKLDSTGNAVLVIGQNSSTIDGSASAVVNSQGQSQDFMSDGTNWYFV